MSSVNNSNRWLILFAAVIFCFVISGTSIFSLIANALRETGEWQNSNLSLAYSLYNVILAIFGIITGAIVKKFSAKSIVYFGLVFYSGGFILSSFSAANHLVFYISFGIIAGIGGGILYNFTLTNTLQWFSDKRGLISGVLGSALFAPLILAPICTNLLKNNDIYQVLRIIGIAFFLILFSVAWLIEKPSQEYIEEYKKEDKRIQKNQQNLLANDKSWNEMLKTRDFWLLWLIFAFANTPSMMMLASVAGIGKVQVGLNQEEMTMAVMSLAIATLIGRFSFGVISDYIGRYVTLFLALVLEIIAIFILPEIKTVYPFILTVMLLKICGSSLAVLFPPITAERFGLSNCVLNYSIMFTAYSAAAFIGGFLADFYKNAENYSQAFFYAGLGLFMAVFILIFYLYSLRKK